jgi:hypothetical protein
MTYPATPNLAKLGFLRLRHFVSIDKHGEGLLDYSIRDPLTPSISPEVYG